MANKAQGTFGTIKWTNLRKVLEEYAQYFIQAARNDLGANKSYASGLLGDTMRSIVQIYDDHYEVDIELQDYWQYVEHGRRPGKFPPPNKIKEWIEIKPVHPYPDAKGRMPTVDQLTFLIGRKIATEGTDPRPFFEKNIQPTYEHFQEAIALAIDEDLAEYIQEMVLERDLYQTLFGIA